MRISDVSSDVWSSDRFYSTVLSGVKERKDLEKRALRTTNRMLGFPLGELFVARHFPESSREKMVEMIENLRATFHDRILKLEWMNEETKEKIGRTAGRERVCQYV